MSSYTCIECGEEYDTMGEAVIEDDCDTPISIPERCGCYECVGSVIVDGSVVNNMKHHTYGEECEESGKERTEYLDLGRKGYYVCPNYPDCWKRIFLSIDV